jgi:hypothetical protein
MKHYTILKQLFYNKTINSELNKNMVKEALKGDSVFLNFF